MSSPSSSIRPLRHWVVVAMEPRPGSTGLLALPDHANIDNVAERCAEVIAVGPGEFTQSGGRRPMTVKVGDRVLVRGFLKDVASMKNYKSWHGADDREYCNIAEPDILAIVGDEIAVGPYNVKAPGC